MKVNQEVTIMRDTNAEIGMAMKKYRKQKKMSMQTVADKLGVTKTAVHYWETGKRTIYAYQLLDYCEAIGVNVNDVLSEVE